MVTWLLQLMEKKATSVVDSNANRLFVFRSGVYIDIGELNYARWSNFTGKSKCDTNMIPMIRMDWPDATSSLQPVTLG